MRTPSAFGMRMLRAYVRTGFTHDDIRADEQGQATNAGAALIRHGFLDKDGLTAKGRLAVAKDERRRKKRKAKP